MVLDNKFELRNVLMVDALDNDNTSLEVMLVNVLPYKKINDSERKVTNVLELLKFSESEPITKHLPDIKSIKDGKIRHFLNVNITNEINRRAKYLTGGAIIDNYIEDRDELIEFSKQDDTIKKVINFLDFKELMELSSEFNDDASEFLGVDGVEMLFYPSLVTVRYIDQKLIPVNRELENNKVFRVPTTKRLYEIVNEYRDAMENGEEVIFITTDDRYYIAGVSIYGYPVIYGSSLDVYFRQTILPEDKI